MLSVARRRAQQLGVPRTYARQMPWRCRSWDASFDTVVCTFALCAIPNDSRVVCEMNRVLRPADDCCWPITSPGAIRALRALQRVVELVTLPLQGEHFRRRPLGHLRGEG